MNYKRRKAIWGQCHLPEKKACLQNGKTVDVGHRQAMCPISTQSTL